MTKTLIDIALTLGLGLFSAPAFAGGYVVNGHAASAAEMQFLCSAGQLENRWLRHLARRPEIEGRHAAG
jgi:hypothetical protein